MNIDFSKVIFTPEFRVTLYLPYGWLKGWILFNLDMSVTIKKREDNNEVIGGIVDQTIIGLFKVVEKVSLNSVN